MNPIGGAHCAAIGLAATDCLPAARVDEAAWLPAASSAVLLRHARSLPGIGDPPGCHLGDCSTRRNLSEVCCEQARRFVAEFTRRGVVVDGGAWPAAAGLSAPWRLASQAARRRLACASAAPR